MRKRITDYGLRIAFLLLAGVCSGAQIGVHSFAWQEHGVGSPTEITTSAVNTAAAGSTFVVLAARYHTNQFAGSPPTDNKGNTYTPITAAPKKYSLWPTTGTLVYVCTNGTGGSGHTWTLPLPNNDEASMVAVEVKTGGVVSDWKWSEVLAGNPLTSESCSAAGVVVAFWCGDGMSATSVSPEAGWTELSEIVGVATSYIQMSSAAKIVDGSATVTWTESPDQGAQLWMIGVSTPGTSARATTSRTSNMVVK